MRLATVQHVVPEIRPTPVFPSLINTRLQKRFNYSSKQAVEPGLKQCLLLLNRYRAEGDGLHVFPQRSQVADDLRIRPGFVRWMFREVVHRFESRQNRRCT